MTPETTSKLRRALALVAPGTAMRDGLERIVHGGTGAIVVLGDDGAVEALCTGGFTLDVPFTATALRELAKMDGAIILDESLTTIRRAAVHLMPERAVTTTEAGTRHRTADRVSRQTGVPVVIVSASMSTIALFVDGFRHLVERPELLLSRANQALATLAHYRSRLVESAARLSALEVQDQVTVRDVAYVVQRLAMARRLRDELDRYVTELGVEARLVQLQLRELTAGIDGLAMQLERDYDAEPRRLSLSGIDTRSNDTLGNLALLAQAAGLSATLDARLHAHGHRQLAQLGRLPASVADQLVERFGSLQELFGASAADLMSVEGINPAMARAIREGLVRLAESAYTQPMT